MPLTIGMIYYKFYQQRKQAETKVAISWTQIRQTIPMFVVFFVLAVLFSSIVTLPPAVTSLLSQTSKIFMTIALVAIGLGVHIEQIKKAGLKPILLGGLTWLAVLVTSVSLIEVLYR